MRVNAEFPEKLNFLFHPYSYKIARGGRGSAKSWSFARALLLMGVQRKLRVLCAREVQLSIKQSVHKLLKDQIELLGLSSYYQIYDAEIRCRNGTEFAFTGLSTLTVDTIKSFEGVDICWVEEGQTITKRSWEILDPTIRKDDSEIWVSYNPQLDTDETHQRFTIHPPEGTMNVEINWRDNPWFSDVLERKRLHCLKNNPDDYENIWEGICRPAEEGTIYYKQMQEVESQGRICNAPYDPMLKVHVVFDLGWEDSLGCALVQRLTSEIRIIEYLEANQTDFNKYNSELRTRNYNWGRVWLPHDGFSRQLNSGGLSSKDILIALGWDVAERSEIVELSVDEGIRNTRLSFNRFYFDKAHTSALEPIKPRTPGFNETDLNGRMTEAIKRYKRAVSPSTGVVGKPMRTPFAHAADVLRYIAANADKMENEESAGEIDMRRITQTIIIPGHGVGSSWMAG